MRRAGLLVLCVAVLAPGAAAGGTQPDGVLVAAIGDAGKAGTVLDVTSGVMGELYLAPGRPLDLLLFLGDNFYEIGLGGYPGDAWQAVVDEVLREPFGPLLARLGRDRVHAVAGNHDYYTRVSLGLLALGFGDEGNRRAQGLEEWTYHYDRTDVSTLRMSAGEVQLIYFDSARLLRRTDGWEAALGELEERLRGSDRPEVRWRVLVMHHPLYSRGDHSRQKALGAIKALVDPEDLGDGRYVALRQAIRDAIRDAGVPVHLVLAGHEHDLQLLWNPMDRCGDCPAVHVVSGAGSKVRPVAVPGESHFAAVSSSGLGERRESRPGFVELLFQPERVRIAFCSREEGPGGEIEAADMGGGFRSFAILPQPDGEESPRYASGLLFCSRSPGGACGGSGEVGRLEQCRID